jgi:hypothetical protein
VTREELLREKAELVPDRVVMRRRKKKGGQNPRLIPMGCVYNPDSPWPIEKQCPWLD